MHHISCLYSQPIHFEDSFRYHVFYSQSTPNPWSDSIHDISKNLISKESTNDSIQIENSNVLFFEKLNVTKEGKKDFEKQIVEPKKQSLKDPSNLETNVNGPYINKYVEISVKRPKIQDKGMLPSAANRFNTNNSQLSSDSWTPILFNECLSSFKNSAPCILKANPDSNILQAQVFSYKKQCLSP